MFQCPFISFIQFALAPKLVCLQTQTNWGVPRGGIIDGASSIIFFQIFSSVLSISMGLQLGKAMFKLHLIVWFVCWLTATSGHFSASAASALHLSSMGLRDFIGMFASTMFELFKDTWYWLVSCPWLSQRSCFSPFNCVSRILYLYSCVHVILRGPVCCQIWNLYNLIIESSLISVLFAFYHMYGEILCTHEDISIPFVLCWLYPQQ